MMKRKPPGRMSYEFFSIDRSKKQLTQNVGNRPFTGSLQSNARKYALDIVNDMWNEDAPNPIVISSDGNLCDGQTRLHAIILANKGIHTWVYYLDKPKTAMSMIGIDDTGNRGLADHTGEPKSVAATASCMCSSLRFFYGHHLSMTQKELLNSAFSNELAELRKYPWGKMNGVNTGTVRSGFAISMALNPDMSDKIAEQYSKLTMAEEGRWTSIVALQQWLDKNGEDSGIRDRRTSIAMFCSDPKNRNRKTFGEGDIKTVSERNAIVLEICKQRGFPLPEPLNKPTEEKK